MNIARLIELELGYEGYQVSVAHEGNQGLDLFKKDQPDLVLLDVMLPGLDGVEVCKRLRQMSKVPVIMLTAKDGVQDRVVGLDSGADDYLEKPYNREELLARIRALLRRHPPRGSAMLTVGDLRLNPDSQEAMRGDREVELTKREFELLEYLMRNQRLVISRERLLEEVWGYDPLDETNTIDVFISNLRRKLEEGGESRILHTKRGAGYVIKA